MIYIYTAGKISIEPINIFLRKDISNRAVDMRFLPHGNSPYNAHIQRNQNIYVHKLSL